MKIYMHLIIKSGKTHVLISLKYIHLHYMLYINEDIPKNGYIPEIVNVGSLS